MFYAPNTHDVHTRQCKVIKNFPNYQYVGIRKAYFLQI